jgi:hypothetical protein
MFGLLCGHALKGTTLGNVPTTAYSSLSASHSDIYTRDGPKRGSQCTRSKLYMWDATQGVIVWTAILLVANAHFEDPERYLEFENNSYSYQIIL